MTNNFETFAARAESALMRHRRIDETTGCWLWTGCQLPTGHGQMHIQGTTYLTHRIAAFLWLGLDIEDRRMGSRKSRSQVNHKCANASCFNPEHIYIGTQKQNIGDIDHSKRRLPQVCKKGHPFTPETYEKYRGCFICRDAYVKAWQAKNRDRINARQQRRRAALKAAQQEPAA